jgi:DNA-binding SARP family transcriptional activator
VSQQLNPPSSTPAHPEPPSPATATSDSGGTFDGDLAKAVLDRLPHGIVVIDGTREVVALNAMAREQLAGALQQPDGAPARCCDLFRCHDPEGPLPRDCLTLLARAAAAPLPEIRVDLPSAAAGDAAWVTVTPLEQPQGHVVVALRPGERADRRRRTEPHWTGRPRLKVCTLGRTRVESAEGPIGGAWLEHRAGQLLKLLVCERDRTLTAEEIAEALWPATGRGAPATVRYVVHVLRQRIEPTRSSGDPSAFIVARNGGYAVDRARVRVDADEFEAAVEAGLGAFARGEASAASESLEEALRLYEGDFLADEPSAAWAFLERERLRNLASRALLAAGQLALDAGDPDAAAVRLERAAELHPLDTGIQRRLIALCLRRERESEAARRYEALRARLDCELGKPVEFELAELLAERGEPLRLA